MTGADEHSRRDRARGLLVGLAAGDALGAPVEFDPPAAIEGRREQLFAMPGGGGFGWAPGEFTDDTQMSLLLARRLSEDSPLDLDALAADFAAWATHPRTADVGTQTRQALGPVRAGTPWREAVQRLRPDAAGNGSLMRVAPVALVASDAEQAAQLGRQQSEVTHPNEWCVDACAVAARALFLALDSGATPDLEALAATADTPRVRDAVLAAGEPGAPRMSGFVLDTLTGALWAVAGASTFEDAVWRAVALGHDADTVGAVAGALAGARFGRTAIPDALAERLCSKHPLFAGVDTRHLEALADTLTDRRRGD